MKNIELKILMEISQHAAVKFDTTRSVSPKGSQYCNQILSYLPVISMYLLGEHFDEAE